MIYNIQDHQFVADLISAYPSIKNEYEFIIRSKGYKTWPEEQLHNGKWNVFGFTWLGQEVELAHKLCLQTSEFLHAYPSVFSAGFSKMEAGAIIYPHEGYTNKVVRVHLGIDVPEGDCGLQVGDQILRWRNGEVFAFDDTVTHQAWNKTPEARVVLLLDIKKEFLLGE